MEFVALLVWLLLAGTGAILLPFAFTVPGSGLSAMAGTGGMIACILFIVLGAPVWAGWAQVGLAALGIVGATLAAAQLLDERFVIGSVTEEIQAAVVGLQLPFYFCAVFVTLLVALDMTEPVV